MASETYCTACGDHAPVILGRCASCWGSRPLETALADMALLAREAEEARDADEEIARLTRELEEARERERRLREAHERSVGVFRRACEIAEAAILAGETPETASARLRNAIESDIAEINALVALSTPQGEGERANCRCAPAAPWRSDGATCPDWPGCGNPDWRPATPEEASGAD